MCSFGEFSRNDWPKLIHFKKDFSTYLFFASSLLGQKKELEKLSSFGTDGEKALIDAFSHEFHFSRHLTCFIHVCRNVKEELAKCDTSEEIKQSIVDIFGKPVGSTFIEGLVDANDEDDFQEMLKFLIEKWSGYKSCATFLWSAK